MSNSKSAQMYKVFISYSSEDTAFVAKLEKSLRSIEFKGFLDQDDIAQGEKLSRAISNAIQNSERLLVIFSNSSIISPHVMFEIGVALSFHKKIISVVLPNTNFEDIDLNAISDTKIFYARDQSFSDLTRNLRYVLAHEEV